MNDTKLVKSLNSDDHLEVAMGLTDILLGEYSSLSAYKPLMADLTKLRDTIWKGRDDFAAKHARSADNRPILDEFKKDEAYREQVFSDILGNLKTDADRELFMEAYSRMGHLYEMAGLIARDNFFTSRTQPKGTEKKLTPGGPEEFIKSEINAGRKVPEIVAKYNLPTTEYVFTAHPTNTNSLNSMQIQRQIASAFRTIREATQTGDMDSATGALKQAVHRFIEEPLTPQSGKEVKNVDVKGETQQMLHFLGNAYDDLNTTYRRFDSPLERQDKSYDPTTLNLKFKFTSWGSSGDKDGNKKVNAQSTLLSMVMHREAILTRYKTDLQSINDPLLADMQSHITQALQTITPIKEALEKLESSSSSLSDEKFNELSAAFADSKIDVKEFETTLLQAYAGAKDDGKKKTLNLLRHVRTFGDTFGHIEYRETAEEFTRIAELLVDGYGKMDEKTRVAKLTDIIQTGKAPALLQQKIDAIKAGAFDDKGNYKAYSNPDTKKGKADTDADKMPIAYQTIKRLELVRDHPEMVVNQVMAECENTSNFLEVKMLMEALKTREKKPVLGIIPLFEKPEVMRRVGDIMKDLYGNAAYHEHMKLFEKTHPEEMEVRDGKVVPTQQIQFAHSDNSRRAGMSTARANIDEAHNVTYAVGKEFGIETRYYQGGSQTDPFRGGTRSQTATINQFGLHNFFKTTVQGGDLLNFFNYPHSMIRNLTRVMTHCAENFMSSIRRDEHEKTSHPVNLLARSSLQGIEGDYNAMFSTDMLGKILGESGFGAAFETPGGQAGSRASRKSNDDFASVTFENSKAPVNPDDIRTINFSELFQHDGITPTFLGVRNLKHMLSDFCSTTLTKFQDMRNAGVPLKAEEANFEDILLDIQKNTASNGAFVINPKAVQKLYEVSPVFRDNIDRIAYGISLTNLDTYEKNHPSLSQDRGTVNADGTKAPSIMKLIRSDYMTAANLSIAALTGQLPKDKEVGLADPPGQNSKAFEEYATWLREQVRAGLAYGHTLSQKGNYMEFVQAFKQDWMKKHDSVGPKMVRLCHNALDTVTHGRIPMADDPSYAKAYKEHKEPQRAA